MGNRESNKDKPKDKKPFNIKRMVLRPTTQKKVDEYFSDGLSYWDYEEERKMCLQYTEEAYKKGEFKELLMGEKDYRIYIANEEYYIDTDTGYAYYAPTDMWGIMEYGIYKYYKQTNDEKIITDFVAAMEEMINGEAYDVFTALFYLFCISAKSNIGIKAFNIGEEIYHKTGEKLKQFDYDDFVVTEIKRFTRIILKDEGIDIGYNTEV